MFTTIPPLRTIIADDSPEILALMRSLVEEVAPTLEIVATCTSLAKVDLAIKKFAPQLLILDIQFAPEGRTAFDLLEEWQNFRQFQLIIFSGHCEFKYAQQAIYEGAVAFLDKPIDKESLHSAIEKAAQRIYQSHETSTASTPSDQTGKWLQVSTAVDTRIFHSNQIVYIQSSDGGCKIYLSDGEEIYSTKNIGVYDRELQGLHIFVRTHQSYIVNLNYIQGYTNRTERKLILRSPFPQLPSSKIGFKNLNHFFSQNRED